MTRSALFLKVKNIQRDFKILDYLIYQFIKPYSPGVMSEMPPNDWKPDDNEIARRKDFRKALLVMSIDPKGCQDVDDALAVKYLPSGNIQLAGRM